ncbi:MAG: hypothetical protein HZC36_04215 [Armatimonadetes bacterium]|nr:hypothetical protein [Armatimonadota bacterium]
MKRLALAVVCLAAYAVADYQIIDNARGIGRVMVSGGYADFQTGVAHLSDGFNTIAQGRFGLDMVQAGGRANYHYTVRCEELTFLNIAGSRAMFMGPAMLAAKDSSGPVAVPGTIIVTLDDGHMSQVADHMKMEFRAASNGKLWKVEGSLARGSIVVSPATINP